MKRQWWYEVFFTQISLLGKIGIVVWQFLVHTQEYLNNVNETLCFLIRIFRSKIKLEPVYTILLDSVLGYTIWQEASTSSDCKSCGITLEIQYFGHVWTNDKFTFSRIFKMSAYLVDSQVLSEVHQQLHCSGSHSHVLVLSNLTHVRQHCHVQQLFL